MALGLTPEPFPSLVALILSPEDLFPFLSLLKLSLLSLDFSATVTWTNENSSVMEMAGVQYSR